MLNPNLLKNKSYYMNFKNKNMIYCLYNPHNKIKVQVA